MNNDPSAQEGIRQRIEELKDRKQALWYAAKSAKDADALSRIGAQIDKVNVRLEEAGWMSFNIS